MKLFEIMSLGDDNVLGRLVHTATKNLQKFQGGKDKEACKLACGLISTLKSFDANPNIAYGDGYSLINYLQQLSDANIDIRGLRAIADALGSYDDSSGE